MLKYHKNECYIMIPSKDHCRKPGWKLQILTKLEQALLASEETWEFPSSHRLRSYLPSLCSLGQRVKKLTLLREPLTSFVKENTAIFCMVVTIHRVVPVEADCCMFFWCGGFQTGLGSVQPLNSSLSWASKLCGSLFGFLKKRQCDLILLLCLLMKWFFSFTF